jgi:two-component system, sensor histidine kinase ChiS
MMLSSCSDGSAPKAVDGVLDLRGVDLDVRSVALQGAWRVFPSKLLGPTDSVPVGDDSNYTNLPGGWRDLARTNSGKIADYATFHLTVLLDTSKVDEIEISCTEHSSAYRLWADGVDVIGDGRVGKSSLEEVPGYHFRRNTIRVRAPKMELVLQTSNHYLGYGGRILRFRLGSRSVMNADYDREYAWYMGALATLLLLAIQYLGFLSFILKDRTYFLFGLSCLFLFGMGIFIPAGFGFATSWWPGLSLQATTTAGLSCAIFGLMLVGWFCHSMFPNRALRTLNRWNLTIATLTTTIFVFGPYSWTYPVMGGALFLDYALVAMVCYTLAKAIRKRTDGAITFTIGLGLFMIGCVHDSLVFFSFIEGSFVLVLGGTALAVAEAFVLTQRWLSTDRANAHLLSEVQAKNLELGRLSKLKDDFLANTSHELRTPLHGIFGLTQTILADTRFDLALEVRRNLEHVASSARRLTRLVNDILDFSKIRHKDLALTLAPVDLAVVVPTILPLFQSTVSAKGIALLCELEPDLPRVLADEDRLVQILLNLVGNSIKFTDWGEVKVRARRLGDGVELSVSDTGIGIDRQAQERIFEPFEQAEGEYRGGTGLGLSITRKLVELHGGILGVTSEIGHGSIFHFHLPLAIDASISVDPASKAGGERRVAESWSGSGPKEDSPVIQAGRFERNVLAIDDEPVNLVILRGLLNSKGIGVVTASDGRRALELIEEHEPAVVLLDVMMPHKDGYVVCAEIRQRHSAADLPVLFLSARSRLEDVIHGFSAGGNDYVLKPFLGQELVARVEAQMRQREVLVALRENRSLKVELAEVVLERRRLELIKKRLTGLLHGLDEPILIVDGHWDIRFANRAFSRILSCDPDDLQERPLTGLLTQAAGISSSPEAGRLVLRLRAAQGSIVELRFRSSELSVDEEVLWVLAAEPEAAPAPNPSLARLLVQKLSHSEGRLLELRGRMDCLTDDLKMDLPIDELQSTFAQIRELVSDRPDEDQKLSLACEVMNDALDLWVVHTGKTKADLAEESGLWAIQVDQNGWRRTATLDKYLDLSKIPRLPKWKTIQKTVEFVGKAAAERSETKALREKAARLEIGG